MNFNSPEWKAVCSEIDERVAKLDVQNRILASDANTSHLRGQIAALLSLRDWERQAAIPIEPEISFE